MENREGRKVFFWICSIKNNIQGVIVFPVRVLTKICIPSRSLRSQVKSRFLLNVVIKTQKFHFSKVLILKNLHSSSDKGQVNSFFECCNQKEYDHLPIVSSKNQSLLVWWNSLLNHKRKTKWNNTISIIMFLMKLRCSGATAK